MATPQRKRNLILASLAAATLLGFPAPLTAQNDVPPPNTVTNAQDMAQMMWQLGLSNPSAPPKLQDPNRITSGNARPSNAAQPEGNWTDDSAQTITRSGAGLWNNYDDTPDGFKPGPQSWRSGATLYAPINDLQMKDGTLITTPEQWWLSRRPEVLLATKEELYGHIPDPSTWPGITWTIGAPTTGTTNGVAWKNYVVTGTIHTAAVVASTSPYTVASGANFVPYTPPNNPANGASTVPRLTFNVRVPATASAENRVGLVIVFGGNTRFSDTGQYNYGVAGYTNTQLQPDAGGPNLSHRFLIGMFKRGNWRQPNDWGALAAWGWGISRFIDYLEGPGGAELGVNPKRLGVQGHSRYGKASLVAGAYDPRILVVWASSSGSLGASPYRRHWGQELANSVWDQEYHWMAGNFMKWAGQLLPPAGTLGTVDHYFDENGKIVQTGPGTYIPTKKALMSIEAHSVAALIAPRVLMITGGNAGDDWTDPYGMFMTARDTAPVYNLLGRRGLILTDGDPKPVVNKDYVDGHVSYRYHQGGHTDAPNWATFARYAGRFFNDNTAPEIGVPAAISVWPADASGAVVDFDLPLALDEVDDQTPVMLSHQPGSVFPVGTTVVTATSTDISGNTGSASFEVTVKNPYAVTRGGFSVNRRTNQVTQQVTIKNVSPNAYAGPVYLVLESLSSNTSLLNGSGLTNGNPYIVVGAGGLAAGASASVVLQFSVPASGGITYTPATPLALPSAAQ